MSARADLGATGRLSDRRFPSPRLLWICPSLTPPEGSPPNVKHLQAASCSPHRSLLHPRRRRFRLAASTPLGTTRIIETADSKKACVNPLIENPFAQFGDNLDYVLAPDGNFNGDVAGWQFAGGAKVVATDKGRSLQLPKGATAITPSMCLDLHFPTFRMDHKVVRDKNGLLVLGKADRAVMKVEVVYYQIANPMWTEMKSFDGRNGIYVGNSWKLTDPIDLKPALGGPHPALARPRCVSRSWMQSKARASCSTTSTSTRCAGSTSFPEGA